MSVTGASMGADLKSLRGIWAHSGLPGKNQIVSITGSGDGKVKTRITRAIGVTGKLRFHHAAHAPV